MPELNTTLGNGRFLLTRKLGVGGMGSVYEALDSKRNVSVALKSLGQIDPLAVGSFKAEFRDFQHLHHPNLIVLDEFFSEQDEWHFTMELLGGHDFLAHVRRRGDTPTADLPTEMASGDAEQEEGDASSLRVYPGALDIPALAETLRQLTAGLSHLHSAGKVHRDVKSSNVIITEEGRTVLLDFGVSVDIKGKGVQLAGTPLYMAPELFWQSATPAADWYSVGVLLYQALTGTDPWQGGGIAGLVTTKRPPPTHPSDIDPSIPEELGDLCLSLLAANPRERAGRRAILDWVERTTHAAESPELWDDESDPEIFIGRETELKLLRSSLDDLPGLEEPLVVFIQGESGIGKSALVQSFVGSLRVTDHATVLRARVLEEEVVPYKSVDGIVDSLCEYFLEIGYEKVAPLLPDHFNIVADVFPVLRRSAKVAELPRTAIADPVERRTLMFGALKECLRRLSDRTNLIVTVDDLQWSDADSLQLWNEIVRGPGSPRMLLIATLRTDRTGSIRPSRAPSVMPTLAANMPRLPIPTRSVWLARLTESESRAYVHARLESHPDSVRPEDVIHEASGHPLFIDELLRYRGRDIGAGELTLEYVLAERISHLDADQRKYLKLACLSAKPLPRVVYAKAAGLDHGAGLRAFKALRSGRLLRTGRAPGSDGDDWVDAFHYRVRNACLQDCTGEERASLHRALALTLEREGRLDAEHLAIEWRQAGESPRAAPYAEAAADAAFGALAFRKAAEFYADALNLDETTPAPKRRVLRERLGRSLRNSGRAKAATEVFLPLADESDSAKAFALRCESAELLLRSGHVDDGMVQLDLVMNQAGVSRPKSSVSAVAAMAWRTARIKVRGYKWVKKDASPRTLQAIDALWCAYSGLGSIEQLPAYACGAEYVLRALDSGDPVRVARALAGQTISAAAQGNRVDAATHAAKANELLKQLPDDASQLGVVHASAALADMMSGRWSEALTKAKLAQDWIRKNCVGSFGDLALADDAELWSLAALGKFGDLVTRQNEVVTRARDSNDLYALLGACSGLPSLAYLVVDQPARAIAASKDSMRSWSNRGLYLQHAFDVFARAQASLYSGAPLEAAAALADFDRQRRRRLILLPHPVSGYLHDLSGRVSLAVAFMGRPQALDTVYKSVAKLNAEDLPWTRSLAALLELGASHARTGSVERKTADRVARAFDECAMPYHASLTRLYCDSSHRSGNDDWQTALVDPDRFATLHIPGLRQTLQDNPLPRRKL